ncbi:MAG TPA: hypothetical protein VHL57_00325, partial [Flavobacteriales bacterium]|nr:hypothetical protein [Flavobacteriales bacterium]
MYPTTAVVPNSNGSVTQIVNNAWEEDYSQITGIYAGVTYEFWMGTLHYITVRVGTFDGPVLGQGYAPLQVTTTTTEDLFVHWNVDDQCNTAQNPMVTTVQIIQDCQPPTYTVSTVNDCANGEFSVVVNVTGTGDGSTVDIDYSSVGGTTGSLSAQGIGTHTVGPFADGDTVDIIVQHASDDACNVPTFNITNIPCPIISCGPDTYTYCYENGDTVYFVYQASNT